MKIVKLGRRVPGAEVGYIRRRLTVWGGAFVLCTAVTACSESGIDPATLHVAGMKAESATSLGRQSDSADPKRRREWARTHRDYSLSSEAPERPETSSPSRQTPLPRPKVVAAARHLECVPYAREQSKIRIRGHSWQWWYAARGHYERSSRPRANSVLVFKRNRQSRGHLAVVTRVMNKREVIVSHANWLNRGKIHLNAPVRDVSRKNDWTRVRVWYTPGSVMGKSRYRTYGFIHPNVLTAQRSPGQKR